MGSEMCIRDSGTTFIYHLNHLNAVSTENPTCLLLLRLPAPKLPSARALSNRLSASERFSLSAASAVLLFFSAFHIDSIINFSLRFVKQNLRLPGQSGQQFSHVSSCPLTADKKRRASALKSFPCIPASNYEEALILFPDALPHPARKFPPSVLPPPTVLPVLWPHP